MIKCTEFHEICRKCGLIQCGDKINQYMFPNWNNKIGNKIVATWFKGETVTAYELKVSYFTHGTPAFILHPVYKIENADECENIIQNTMVRAKKLCEEYKMIEMCKDFI